jgi:hypothetical protein
MVALHRPCKEGSVERKRVALQRVTKATARNTKAASRRKSVRFLATEEWRLFATA